MNINIRKISLRIILPYLVMSSLVQAQGSRHVEMTKDFVCADLKIKEIIEVLNGRASGVVEEEIQEQDDGVIYLEVSSDRINSIEDLSSKQQALYRKDPEGFTKYIKKVPSFEYQLFSTLSGGKVELSWRDGFGWGKMTKRTFEEIYLLTGEFSDLAKQLGRFTPKKTEDYYKQYYEKILIGYPAGKIPFEKLDDQTWLFGYARRSSFSNNNQDPVKITFRTSCYLEKYAKSLEITSQAVLPNNADLNKLARKEIDKLMSRNKLIFEMIRLRIKEKELKPNKKSISMLNNDRIKRTVGLNKTDEEKVHWMKDPQVPDFVKEIERLRLPKDSK